MDSPETLEAPVSQFDCVNEGECVALAISALSRHIDEYLDLYKKQIKQNIYVHVEEDLKYRRVTVRADIFGKQRSVELRFPRPAQP